MEILAQAGLAVDFLRETASAGRGFPAWPRRLRPWPWSPTRRSAAPAGQRAQDEPAGAEGFIFFSFSNAAAGGLDLSISPGRVVLIRDHINTDRA